MSHHCPQCGNEGIELFEKTYISTGVKVLVLICDNYESCSLRDWSIELES